MKRVFVVVSLFFFNNIVFADTLPIRAQGGENVVVPMIFGDPTGSDLVSGMLYYNTSSDSFVGVDNSGNKVQFGGATSNAVTSAGSEKIERAFINGAASSITSTSSSWLTSVSRSSAGIYTLNYTGFNNTPTCVISLQDTSNGIIRIYGAPGTTSTQVSVTNPADSANVDRNFAVICMSAR